MHPDLFRIPGTNFMVPGYGAAVIVAFLVGTWWMTRRAAKVKADPDIVLSLALIALVFGWLGGRVFYVIHYWKTQFAHQPWTVLQLNAGGFEVYGGLITAAVFCMLYLRLKGVSIRLYADMAAPTILFGMGVGRIGCFLVGCCWGATCPASLPWGVTFPALSSPAQQHWQDRLMALPADLIIIDPTGQATPFPRQILAMKEKDFESLPQRLGELREVIQKAEAEGNALKVGQARAGELAVQTLLAHFDAFETTPGQLVALADSGEFRSAHVHPAQLYSAVGPLLLALLTSAYFYRRRRHGTVMILAMVLYGIERFIEEWVRIDNPRDTFGLTISQGISIGFIAFAGLWYLILLQMPLRSSRPGKREPKAPPPQAAATPA